MVKSHTSSEGDSNLNHFAFMQGICSQTASEKLLPQEKKLFWANEKQQRISFKTLRSLDLVKEKSVDPT